MLIGSKTARHLSTIWIAAFCFMWFASSNAVGEDPLLRAPIKDFPEFRRIVPLADYATKLAASSESLKVARKQASGSWPTTGAIVNYVVPGSQADVAGVQKGDILIRFDDWLIWTAENLPRAADYAQRCEFFSVSSGRQKSFTAQPGPLGVKNGNSWRPDLVYLRSRSSDARWDADVYLAITTAAREPDLAETAWSYAVEKGYKPDAHAAASGIEIRFAQGRGADAWEFASLASQTDAAGDTVAHPILLMRAAVANYQLRELMRLTERYPQASAMSAEYVQLLLDLHLRRPANEREAAPPHVLAESMARDDLRSKLIPQRQTTALHGIAGLKRGDILTVKTESGFFQENAISPSAPAPNVDISFGFTWRPAPGDDKGYRKQAVFQLVDGRVDTRVELDHLQQKPALIGWSVAEELCELRFSSASPNLTYADESIERGDKVHTVRFVRVSGQAELFVNGCRLLYVPVDQGANEPWLFFRTIGSTMEIRDLKFDELIDTP